MIELTERRRPAFALCLCAALLAWVPGPARAADAPRSDQPRAADDRLRVDLFAVSPDIVHPVCLDFDARGRLLVIESHTHFPPPNYKGPKHDRIRILEDTDGDGKADRFTTFFEGTTKTMDVAGHPDGSVYVASRSEILRLRDTKGNGKADEKARVVFLDTKGDYPHNGLSGLCFDSQGDLYFGLGENLGAPYRLIGSDGRELTGGGEGGGVFHCTADGRELRRVATGFWNPFGTGRDVFGRLFTVDNDPDASPPCRMVHVVEGGDYGFQFRYGRAGRHPFQAWDGQLLGTLPMLTGVGEAPCEVLSYESDGLPREYLGNLLVTSWADHRVERYVLKPRGASFAAERKPFVQGGQNFRPVGLAVAPDGSLFVSDWVLSDYTLHGKGAVWHIRPKEAHKPDRPDDPRKGLFSAHRPLRESAARRLTAHVAGREFLRGQLTADDVRVRAASLTALIDACDPNFDLAAVADREREPGLRALAVRTLAARGEDVRRFLDAKQPAEVRAEAVVGLRATADLPRLTDLLADADPFLRHAAVRQLAHSPDLFDIAGRGELADTRHKAGVLLACRASGRPEMVRLLPHFLADKDEEVRFLAAKWIADERLTELRGAVVEALKDRKLNVRLYQGLSTALARLDNQEVNEAKLAEYFLDRLADARSPADLRVKALQMVPATHPRLTADLLGQLLAQDDAALRLEAVRTLGEQTGPKRTQLLLDTARDARLGEAVRAQALLGVSDRAQDHLDDLLRLAEGDGAGLRDEALRALVETKLTPAQRERLEAVAKRRPESAALVARALGRPFVKDRPKVTDVDAWLTLLAGGADADAGRRVFAHPKLAGCARCHRVEGRGQDVGPDLSTIGLTPRRHILESILQPSAEVAPHYQSWRVETADGKVRTGLLVNTYLDEYTYVDEQGGRFKVKTGDVVESRALPTSIMPAGLADRLTDQELRDLLAYLCSRR
jgi:putative membrane-bound dehydrogenase-like protein